MDRWTTWATILAGVVSALAGAAWIVVKMYYRTKDLDRESRIANSDAEVIIAKKDVEEAQAKLQEILLEKQQKKAASDSFPPKDKGSGPADPSSGTPKP